MMHGPLNIRCQRVFTLKNHLVFICKQPVSPDWKNPHCWLEWSVDVLQNHSGYNSEENNFTTTNLMLTIQPISCHANYWAVTACRTLIHVLFQGGGSGLLRREKTLESVIRCMSGVIDLPLTVKTRTGVYTDKNIAHTFMPKFHDWGASLVTVSFYLGCAFLCHCRQNNTDETVCWSR